MRIMANPPIAGNARGRRFGREALLLVFLLVSLVGFGGLTIHQWMDLHQINRYLKTSILAKSTADYSGRRPTAVVARVGLGIVRDIIRDSQAEPGDLNQRLAKVTAQLLLPVPSATSLPGQPVFNPGAPTIRSSITITPAATRPDLATVTQSHLTTPTHTPIAPTLTFVLSITPSLGPPTSAPTLEKSWTTTRASPTQTMHPRTPTPKPLPTKTSLGTSQPPQATATRTHTNQPAPTLTASPGHTATLLPEVSSTPAATPTTTDAPTSTAIVTMTPTEAATPTESAIPTETPIPTSTPTGCSAPLDSGGGLPNGYILGVDPPDGATSVTLSGRNTLTVYFNQNLDMTGNDAESQSHYEFRNLTTANVMSVTSITYNPLDQTITLAFDNTRHWDPTSNYSLTIKRNLANACMTHQGVDVTTTFSTGP
jgi:hypothetical protein